MESIICSVFFWKWSLKQNLYHQGGQQTTTNYTSPFLVIWPAIGYSCWPGTCFPRDKSYLEHQTMKSDLSNWPEGWLLNTALSNIFSVIYKWIIYTLQSTTCSPLPLGLRRESFSFPLAEGLSVIPAHVNYRKVQALPNSWTRSCRLRSRG